MWFPPVAAHSYAATTAESTVPLRAFYARLMASCDTPLMPTPSRIVLASLLCACAARQAVAPPPAGPPPVVELSPIAAEPWTSARAADPDEMLSADGRTRTRRGPCAHDANPPADRVFSCTSAPDWPAREWSFEGDGRVIDVLDAHALVLRTHNLRASSHPPDGVNGQRAPAEIQTGVMSLFEIDRARWIPLELIEPTAEWLRAGFTARGDILGLVRTGRGREARVWIAHGPARAVIQMLPLDRAADDVAQTSAGDYVITIGERAFWIGAEGLTVRPVALPPGVSLGAPETTTAGQTGERVRCDGAGCVIDGRVRVPLRTDRSVP